MSVATQRIRCTGCDFEAFETFRPIRLVYRLNDGREVETGKVRGWCYRCDNFAYIERLDPQRLRQELSETERAHEKAITSLAELSSIFLAKYRKRSERGRIEVEVARTGSEIDTLRELFQIAVDRRSRPRCLRCWSEDTAPVTFDWGDNTAHDFKHKCGGRLIMSEFEGALRFSYIVQRLVLNAEGELLD